MGDEFFFSKSYTIERIQFKKRNKTPNPNPNFLPLRTALENLRGDCFCHLPGHTVNLLPLPLFFVLFKEKERATKILERNIRETKMGLCGLPL